MYRLRADVVFVQETHFRDDRLPILKNKSFPMTYHSTFPTAKARGVSILLSARVPWKHLEGRFLFLKGMIGNAKVTLANLYVPNSQPDLFIGRHIRSLLEFTEGHLILGGDFNFLLIPAEDTSSGVFFTNAGHPEANLKIPP